MPVVFFTVYISWNSTSFNNHNISSTLYCLSCSRMNTNIFNNISSRKSKYSYNLS